ncbi:MAG: hypothetical protein IPP48_12585 [Chitinophagaceae bacterium]|nr:hypothetical protein [Chitinophagaceae bacterium]
MLEGLAKLYKELHNEKRFTKIKEQCKLIEDSLGQIDYYDFLQTAFAENKQIPPYARQYVKQQFLNKIAQLNEILIDKDWIKKDNKRVKKIAQKISEADWMKPQQEVESIQQFYGEAIYAIIEFLDETSFHFDNVEEDVHELRRKLRWLSIYPHALQGCIQLTKEKKMLPHLKKYLTKAITTSPFNSFPAAADNTSFLLLNKNYFLALSWLIAELGNLKDEGLIIAGLKEAIQQATSVNDADAYKKTYILLGKKQRKMESILNDAEKITKTFVTENNLEHLVFSTATIAEKNRGK